MPKVWDGQTPYLDPMPGSGWTHYQQSQADKSEGFRDAMNSLTVRAMYEVLSEHLHSSIRNSPQRREDMRAACDAYEAGLREAPDGNQ